MWISWCISNVEFVLQSTATSTAITTELLGASQKAACDNLRAAIRANERTLDSYALPD
jgi:hypothetical protein